MFVLRGDDSNPKSDEDGIGWEKPSVIRSWWPPPRIEMTLRRGRPHATTTSGVGSDLGQDKHDGCAICKIMDEQFVRQSPPCPRA